MSEQKTFKKLYDACVKLALKNKDLIEKTGRSVVASVVVGKSGKTYYGMNVGWWHSTCAEATSLSNAWRDGEREMRYVLAVKYNKRDNKISLISPCGICREMFSYLNPEIKVILQDESQNFVAVPLNELLPELEDLDH